ncbi:UvrD-helicase domain-containing protein [Romboutsia sp. 1001713B170207_170306_H8]|uniref:UvrD-helicase domain-containing protein n=1 Tax=Romboutsia sp. 1001713B170207_170306_H8 TaxID=2787112 RepID=UPI00189B6796|nr:UvrD-helicase domain-containing protein [Romboutsia sp. 1001713B170207_170306_H8]
MLYYIFFIYVFALIILVSIRNTKSNKIKGSSTYKELNLKIEKFISEFEKAKSGYFTNSIKVKIINEYKDIYKLTRTNKYKKLNNVNINKFNEIYRNLDKLVREYNKTYINKELLEHKDLLDNIDGKSLDKQQREAVVVDEDNNLVLAGAGSGKTLTISGKVKYLVDAKNIKAEEILLISFTKKAAEEMNERISQKLGLNVESKTFHKLGLDIIKEKRKKSPDISDSLNKVINNYFKEAVYKDKANLNNLMGFYGCYIDIPKDLDDFENLGEYYKHFNSSNFTTIKGKLELQNINKAEEQKLKIDKKTINGEQVKSIEEVIIANYLYLNGVKYIYEYQYPYDIEDNYRKIYRPDFYLPDYDVYIEHFGVNKDYNAPWLSEIEEQKYVEGIQWKRELHK